MGLTIAWKVFFATYASILLERVRNTTVYNIILHSPNVYTLSNSRALDRKRKIYFENTYALSEIIKEDGLTVHSSKLLVLFLLTILQLFYGGEKLLTEVRCKVEYSFDQHFCVYVTGLAKKFQ